MYDVVCRDRQEKCRELSPLMRDCLSAAHRIETGQEHAERKKTRPNQTLQRTWITHAAELSVRQCYAPKGL